MPSLSTKLDAGVNHDTASATSSNTGVNPKTPTGSDLLPKSQSPPGYVVAKNDYTKLATTVRQILDSPTISKRFREYAASLHADEGLRFLEDFQHAHSRTDVNAAADELMAVYFMDDALHQVNLPAGIRRELLEKYKSRTYQTLDDLFDETMYEVFTDIKKSDTFRNFINTDEEAKRISSDESLLLDEWLSHENFHLAMEAIGNDTTLGNLVRFCISATEFEKQEEKTARKAQGYKISATFIQVGSPYQISLHDFYTKAFLKSNFHGLPDARMEVLQTLAKNTSLMNVVRMSMTESRSGQSSSQDAPVVNRTADVQRIFHSSKAKEFIQRLVQLQTKEGKTLANKARFCLAVTGFMSTPGTCARSSEKRGKARKIVSTFIEKGSIFEVEVSSGFMADLCKKRPMPDYAKLLGVIFTQFVADMGASNMVSNILDGM